MNPLDDNPVLFSTLAIWKFVNRLFRGSWTRRTIPKFLFAIPVVFLFLGLRLLLQPYLEPGLTFVTFYPAVMLVALVAGPRPGIFATLLGALTADYFLVAPLHSFSIASTPALAGLILFTLNSLMLCWVASLYNRAKRADADKVRKLLETGRVGVALINLRGQIVFSNKQWLQLFGYSGTELQGAHASLLVPERIKPAVAQTWNLLTSQWKVLPEPYESESTGLRKDGSEFPLEGSLDLLFLDGEFLVAAEVRDISERKEAEIKLKNAEEKLRLALTAGKLGVWDVDWNTHKAWRSAEHCEIFGYDSLHTEWTLDKFLSHVVPADNEIVNRALEEAARTGKCKVSCRIQRKDNAIRWIEAESVVYKDAQGAPSRMMGTVADITDRKAAETVTQQRAELLDLAHDAIIVRDAEGHITFWSRGAEEIYGWSAQEAVGQLGDELLRTELPVSITEVMAAVVKQGRWEGELKHIAKDGRKVALDSRWSLKHGESGVPIAVLEINRDITDRKRAEAEWKLAFDAVSDSVMLLDNQFRIQRANRATAEILGVPAVELIGKHCHEVFHLLNSPAAGCPMKRMLFSGMEERSDLEEPSLGKIFDVTATPLKDAAGTVQGCVHVVRDVSERKRAEEQIRQASAYSRGLIEASLDPLVTIDPGGKIRDVNRATELVTGLAREKLIGSDFSHYFTEPERAREGYQMAFSKGTVWDYPLVVRHASGKLTDVLYNASIYKNEKGQVEGVFAAARDISELKALQKQLLQSQKMEAIGQLAGGIAHDFNNIMAIILGYSEIAQEVVLPGDPLSKQLTGIQKAALRASSLTNQLLAFGRKQVLQPVLTDLNRNIDCVASMLTRVIGENIELIVEHGQNLPLVKVDPMQIEQVLINLAINARDAMPRGGKLVIKTAVEDLDAEYCRQAQEVLPGSYVVISVSDSGVGMTPETQAHIFEPFFTTKGFGKGTGLGLSIVYGVIKQSGGHISVNSKLGCGTTFKIFLPWATPQTPKMEGGEDATLSAKKQSLGTILLVEDEPDLLEMMRQTLETGGYSVLHANSAEEALEVAGNFVDQIDLLLTDVILKTGMDGTVLAERLRGVRPGVRVIFISGYNDVLITTAQQQARDALTLPKPFSTSLLRDKVRKILNASDHNTLAQSAHEAC